MLTIRIIVYNRHAHEIETGVNFTMGIIPLNPVSIKLFITLYYEKVNPLKFP